MSTTRIASQDAAVRVLVLDADPRALATCAAELSRRGLARDQILAVRDATAAMRALGARRQGRLVAFVTWPVDGPDGRALTSALRARGAHIVAMVSPDRREVALDAPDEGADDVLLTPCPADAFGLRALLAIDAARRGRPAAWFRPRAVLDEALAHATGGEVLVRRRAGTARILVSQGRIAWIHDDAEPIALADRLGAFGVKVTADELARVVEECRRTREHFADVLARWGIAERQAVKDATRAILDERLRRALADEDAAALFAPSRWRDPADLGFTTDELRGGRGTIPPPVPARPSRPSFDEERLAILDAVARDVLAIEGCVAAAVLHYGAAAIVTASGDTERLSLVWTLGAALVELDDASADVLVCASGRGHLARRIPGDAECFVYASFDLAVTPIALARLKLRAAVGDVAARLPTARRPAARGAIAGWRSAARRRSTRGAFDAQNWRSFSTSARAMRASARLARVRSSAT